MLNIFTMFSYDDTNEAWVDIDSIADVAKRKGEGKGKGNDALPAKPPTSKKTVRMIRQSIGACLLREASRRWQR